MSQKELQVFSSEEWSRVVRVFQRLLAPAEMTALARALVESMSREFDLGAAQVWLRAGELNMAGLALTHMAEELELVAQRQDTTTATATPLRVSVNDSLSGFVATEGVPYRWSRLHTPPTDWEDTRWAEEAGYSTGLAVPLTVHGRSVGTLAIWERDVTRQFPEGLALLVAEHASLAITQIRRLHGMKRQVQWLTGLQEVTGLLASRLSPDELYRLIFEQVARILSVGGFSINLYDEESNKIERVLIVDTVEGHYRFRPREPWKGVDGTIWDRVVKTREPILINRATRGPLGPGRDAREWGRDTREIPRGTRNWAADTRESARDTRAIEEGADDSRVEGHAPAASLMFAPMMIGDQIVGVMSAQSATPSAYDQETLDLLSTVANQAALAIENARLLDRLNRQIQETQKANRLKSQFIANISHEVRTPLNSIIGFTRIVKRRGAVSLPEQQVKNLDYVLESADHLLRLISDLLDLSRLEAGRLQVRAESVNLIRLVAGTVAEMEPLLEQSGNPISIDLEEGMGPVRTDPTRVRQILVNLLSNAIKFSNQSPIRIAAGRPSSSRPEGEGWRLFAPPGRTGSGTPPPTPPPVTPPESRDPVGELSRCFFIEVADQGVGIDSSALPELFEEFSQASSGDNRLHTGSGLGLAIVRRLADLMNGSVWVKTSPGAGSTFRVVLEELSPNRTPTPPATGATPRPESNPIPMPAGGGAGE